MIVALRTKAQAARVADLTGEMLIHDDQGRPTAKVALDDFEAQAKAVESVSVLFRIGGASASCRSRRWR
jgi:hypothetical protein